MGVVGTRKPRWECSRGQGCGEDFDESQGFPTQFGRPGRWRALALGLEYWGMAGRCAC